MSELAQIQVLSPVNHDQLVEALAQATPETRLVAGGTDLVPELRHPGCEPDLLVDLTGLAELHAVRLEEGALHVGALVTFTQLQWEPLVRRHALCLSLAAAQVGSMQIRNTGTIGGNVANASPCADGVTALMALDAEVVSVDGSGELRTRPLREVLIGPGRTSLRHDEAIVECVFPALSAEHRSAFAKVGSRTAVSVARLNAAAVVRLDASKGVVTDVRVALGAVGETAFRVPEVERELDGRAADDESACLLAEACTAAVQASIPDRYSLPYKQHAVVGLVYDAWNMLALGPPCEPAWA